MWSSSRVIRAAAVGLAMTAASALSACSGFTPVYGTTAFTDEKVALDIAPPGTRLEQTIYQDLRLRFGKPAGPAPKLTVVASANARQLTDSDDVVTTAQRPHQVMVRADITLVDTDGKVLFAGSRAQTADYNTGGQVLANNQAIADATARAAHLLADTIRLTVLGALAR